MTTLFFAPPEKFDGRSVELPEEEARHIVRVLRCGAGDEIEVVDGEGGRHRVRLTRADRRGAAGEVVATTREVGEPSFRVTMGLGILKQPARFETFVEKAVELGVTEIVPLVTDRTESTRVKADRLRNLLIAAMKQSGRSRLPSLFDPLPLKAMLEEYARGHCFVCHESAASDSLLSLHLEALEPGAGITVLIGPEGGFSDGEVATMAEAGWRVASLGPRRLRAETAAMVAATAVMLRGARR
jgi:16S rRNA (uracil1498-N3)-methyltransferase